jgi:adenylate cyclase class 2
MKNLSDQEIEVKFYIHNLADIQRRLVEFGAKIVQERCLEVNLRFDSPERNLSKDRRVLRLRKDTQNILTVKGPAEMGKTVSIRQEIEVVVDDFDTTRRLLEALGYQVFMIYEKYRAMYRYKKVLVTLDELPYGNFIEIEGPNASAIEQTAKQLGLNWKNRVTTSYLYLFEILKKTRPELDGLNLSFSELKGMRFTPDEFNVHPADLG